MGLDLASRVVGLATKLVRTGIYRRCAQSRCVAGFWDNGGEVCCWMSVLYTGIKAKRGIHEVE